MHHLLKGHVEMMKNIGKAKGTYILHYKILYQIRLRQTLEKNEVKWTKRN